MVATSSSVDTITSVESEGRSTQKRMGDDYSILKRGLRVENLKTMSWCLYVDTQDRSVIEDV